MARKKNSIRCWAAAFALALVIVPGARADEASKRAKVEELVTVMHMDRMMDQMVEALKSQTAQMMQQLPDADSMTPEQKKIMADYQDKTLQIVIDSVGWKSMKPEFVTLYVQNFTEEEIDGMVAFYKSPSGQAVLNKMPQLMTAAMKLTQSRMVDVQPKLKALTDDLTKQLEAATPKSSTPAAKN
jgi:uncharacterized protein